jgi:hypothetical protein
MIDFKCSFFVVTSGKPLGQIEPHLMAENAERARPRAVGFGHAAIEDQPQKVEISLHGASFSRAVAERQGRQN